MRKVTRNRLTLEQLEDRCTPSLTPIPDLGTGTYLGQEGGLYPGGVNSPPTAYLNFGINSANAIQPLDANGNPDPNGKIGILLIGDTFTQQIGKTLIADAKLDPSISSHIVFVNAGQAGQYDYRWAYSPKSSAWAGAASAVAAAGLTAPQVQATWTLFEGHNGAFPGDAQDAQEYEEAILRFSHINYPNAHLAYASPQTHVYPSGNKLFVEPVPYEEGFSIQFTIAAQIAGNDNLNYDPSQGTVVAPQEFWGPYIWANDHVNFNGFNWSPADVNAYGLTAAGDEAVSQALLAFFHSDPTTAGWFNALASDPVFLFNLGATNAFPTNSTQAQESPQAQQVQPEQTQLPGGAWIEGLHVVGFQEVIFAGEDHELDFYGEAHHLGSDDLASLGLGWD